MRDGMASRRSRPRRLPANRLGRRASLIDIPARRERIVSLVGESTVDAALAELHLITELPASMWRQLISFVEKLSRLPWQKRIDLCAEQSEATRRLLVLLVLEPMATARAMRTKLGL